MIEDALRYAGQGFIYLLGGLAVLGSIVCAYGLLKLAQWNLVRSRWFKGKD